MRRIYLVHYHEIGLKGKNRKMFEGRLKRNIAKVTGLSLLKIRFSASRFIVESDKADILKKLKYVFGISSYSPAVSVKPEMDAIKKVSQALAQEKKFSSFAVSASRGDKRFPLTSVEINQVIGKAIKEKTGAKVDLKNPIQTFWIEVTPKEAFVYTEKIAGLGGLPVGSQANILVLLSGGIDSPVAAWMSAKRGSLVDFIHFHNYPFTSRSSIDKVKKLIMILNQYTLGSKLFLVPFGAIQKEILKKCQERLRVILYRRMMFRIAEKFTLKTTRTTSAVLTSRGRALALVTGESLGQVASQTLENLSVVEQVVKLPVLRPLIGFDKEEIITLARKIGTFETSILPHDDCCTLFLPKQPATKARLADVILEEKKLMVNRMVSNAIRKTETMIM